MRITRVVVVLALILLAVPQYGCGIQAGTGAYSLLVLPQSGYQPIYDFISGARKSIDITMYQLADPTAQAALKAAAQRGVTVNLAMTYSSSYVNGFNALAAGGVHVSLYQPNAPIYIHSKAISVNNDTVYIGSSNFTTEMTDQNRNVGIITKDPTVVSGITSTMADDFAGATPYSPSP